MRDDESFARRVTKLGTLSDPVRRALYHFVAAQPGSVSRDQAADGVDVPRHTAKHHLDRLVDEGLLVTEFRRLTGRTGPGAGRPAKLYRRAKAEVAVSLPHRQYDLAGSVLAEAVERSLAGVPLQEAVHEAATAAGVRVADEAGPGERRLSPLRRLAKVLAGRGYEPRVEAAVPADSDPNPDQTADAAEAAEAAGDTASGAGSADGRALVLGNCPFDRLAADHTALICGMNLSFVDAVADGLGCTGLRAELDPDPSRCCVKVLDAGRP